MWLKKVLLCTSRKQVNVAYKAMTSGSCIPTQRKVPLHHLAQGFVLYQTAWVLASLSLPTAGPKHVEDKNKYLYIVFVN